MIFLDSTSFTEEDATFLRNLGEFRHFVYLEAKQCFVFPSKIRGIGQNRKDHKALLEHFLKSQDTETPWFYLYNGAYGSKVGCKRPMLA